MGRLTMEQWERKLKRARWIAGLYGRRTRVIGWRRGDGGWYYTVVFAQGNRQRLGGGR
jgi:hypothetical protein